MSRTSGRLLTTLLALATALGCGRAPEPTPVVWIVVDTLRADHLDWYGYERPTSAGLKRLRSDSILFECAYTPHPETTPAIASLLTGLDPPRHGVRGLYQKLHGDNRSLAEVLADAGYETAAFVSSFVMIRDFCGLDQGFATYDDFVTERERNRDNFERRAAATLALARDFLERRDAGRPLFLFLHLIDPHGPYDPPEPWASRFRTGEEIPIRGTVPLYQRVPGVDRLGPYLDRYDGEIAYVSRELGGFLDHLAETGLYDRALIVFTADHGESFGERGVTMKHGDDVFQENVHVPLLVKLPGARPAGAPRVTAAAVSLTDLAPTTLDMIGLPVLSGLDGVSFRSLLDGRPFERVPVPMWSKPGSEERGFALAAGREKWMIAGSAAPIVRFDLAADPGETAPRAGDEGTPPGMAELSRQWLEHRTPFTVEGNFMETALRGDFVRSRMSAADRANLERLKSLGYIH